MRMVIEQNITLKEVINSKPDMIFFSVKNSWWTHDSHDLQKGPVPLDVCGSPLYYCDRKSPLDNEDRVAAFLDIKAIMKCKDYGKYPVDAFMAMHHQNCGHSPARVRIWRHVDYASYISLAITMGDWKKETPEK